MSFPEEDSDLAGTTHLRHQMNDQSSRDISPVAPRSTPNSDLSTNPSEQQSSDSHSADLPLEDSGFAGLSVQDKRRQGLYGAEAFGIADQSTTGAQSFQYPTAFTHRASLLSQDSQSRPVKAPKISVATHPGGVPAPSPQKSNSEHTVQEVKQDTTTSASPQPAMQGGQHEAITSIDNKAGTDLDRDHQGNLYPRQIPILWRKPRTRQKTCQPSGNTQHKRKHALLTNDILPAPPFVWKGTKDPRFTVFDGFLMFPELCFLLVAHLPLRDLISLYSISKDFHAIIDTRFTTTCLTIATNKAPQSARIFNFRMYAHLCRPDPANRILHPDPVKAASRQPRMIPSFRWVAFVLFREKVVHELMAVFAEHGVPLPAKCEIALKRMWVVMDIPDNARRIGFIHNRNMIPDLDLYFMFCFFVRLDMVCHDPLAREKNDGLRKLMLSQPDGLLSVLLVLKRIQWKREADVLMAWVRHSAEIPIAQTTDGDNDFDAISFGAESIFGVPIKQAGLGKYEYWGRKGAIRRVLPSTGEKQRYGILMRPDQLVMREAVRRGLKFSRIILKSILYGYTDDANLTSVIPRAWPRRIPEWNDEEYQVDDLVGGVSALNVDQGGDILLDLGADTQTIPIPLVTSDQATLKSTLIAKKMQEEEERFLDLCVHFCATEFVKVDKDDPVSRDEVRVLP